jgi:hypothetical protein
MMEKVLGSKVDLVRKRRYLDLFTESSSIPPWSQYWRSISQCLDREIRSATRSMLMSILNSIVTRRFSCSLSDIAGQWIPSSTEVIL